MIAINQPINVRNARGHAAATWRFTPKPHHLLRKPGARRFTGGSNRFAIFNKARDISHIGPNP
jgi:hypothetical protein